MNRFVRWAEVIGEVLTHAHITRQIMKLYDKNQKIVIFMEIERLKKSKKLL